MTQPGQVVDPVARQTAQETRAELLAMVEQRLREFLDEERSRWCGVDRRAGVCLDALRDMIFAGGKRLRPMFCITGFLAAGGDPADERIVDAATGLELLHASALVHDDVMDDSELRRGVPTVHARFRSEHQARRWFGEPRRFGEGIAIVVGDLALVYADRLLAAAPRDVMDLWGELRTELIIGQFLDVAVAAEQAVDVRLARWIAVCKSGRYTIHRPLVLGATLAGRPDLATAFEQYGLPLGEAFQLRDDLIGAFGDGQVAGKPVGLDLEQRKMTLLLTLAAARDEHVAADPAAAASAADLGRLLVDNGARAEVEDHIGGLVERAQQAAAQAPLDPTWRIELAELATLVAYRQR